MAHKISKHVLCGLIFCVALCPGGLVAGNVYKHVDENGGVYYSQIPPREGEVSRITTPAPPADDGAQLPQGESIRGKNGECLTVKCMADEMETDRLKREGEYARRRAENERAVKKKTQDGPSKTAASGISADALQQLCLNGSIGPSTRDCNDVNKLRKWYEAEIMRNEELKFKRETRDPGDKYR